MTMNDNKIIIYNTEDGKVSVSLMAKDGTVWLNQKLMAELFDTSVPNISMHISNILKENELNANSVIKDYLTTATDGKNYNVTFYSLDIQNNLSKLKTAGIIARIGSDKSGYWKVIEN